MDQSSLFRKSALDKLASPERLDVLMKVTSPMGWLSLVTLGVVLVAVIGWSIFGRLDQTVQGSGMLILGEGSRLIRADTPGQLVAVNVAVDDVVQVGDAVAEIAIDRTESTLANMRGELQQAQDQYNRDVSQTAAQRSQFNLEIISREGELEQTRVRLATQEQVVTRAADDLAKGLIARNAYQAEVDRRDTLVREQNQLVRLIEQQRVDLRALDGQVARSRAAVDAAQRRLDLAEADVESSRTVTSPFAGRVVAVPKQVGEDVRPSDPIVFVQETDETMQVALFILEDEAGQVEVGMEVELDLSPSYQSDEYGLLRGQVTEVGQIAVTSTEVERIMASAAGVAQTQEERRRLVTVRLHTADTPTGFEWTSSAGPPALRPQTGLTGTIVVDSVRPISHVLPLWVTGG